MEVNGYMPYTQHVGVHCENPLALKIIQTEKRLAIFEVYYLKSNYDKRKCNKTISRSESSSRMG